MKNNVIFFFVDSVTWNYVGKNRAYVSPTPFLDSLRSESLVTTKLYSYAPYTDAATRSLLQVEIVLMIMAISSEQIHLLLIIIKPSTI